MWFELNKVLTFNALFNFIIGSRGVGKSYSLKKYVIKRFKKYHKQFVYVRRYSKEMKKTAKTYFNDIIKNNEFPDDKITYSNGFFYLNGEVMGICITLSESNYLKSSSYPNVETVIVEEFLIVESAIKYMKNEVDIFMELYETIARLRDVKVFFLSNSIALNNPYFNYFNLSLPYNSNYKLFNNGTILVCIAVNKEYIETKNKTRFGQLIRDTEYGNYAINNEMLDMNDDTFIETKSSHTKYLFTLLINNNKFGIWKDFSQNKLFISNDIINECPINIAFNRSEHNPSSILFKANKNYYNILKQHYNYGLLFFESKKIKSQCNELTKLL